MNTDLVIDMNRAQPKIARGPQAIKYIEQHNGIHAAAQTQGNGSTVKANFLQDFSHHFGQRIVHLINLNTAPQRHRDTEKNNISISCHASSVYHLGECTGRSNN